MKDSAEPMGCALCGLREEGHALAQYLLNQDSPWHAWEEPTQQQIEQRMLARRQQATQELCSVQQQALDQMRAHQQQRETLTDQLYSADPTDQADAYLTLQGIEDADSRAPGCGWLPADATTECDWDPDCPVHGHPAG